MRTFSQPGEQGSADAYVVKIDEDGDLLWKNRYGQVDADDVALSIIELDNGDYAVAGVSDWTSSVWRLSADGEQIWFNRYQGVRYTAVIELKDGDLMLTGWFLEEDQYQGLVARIQQNGESVWSNQFGGEGYDLLFGLRETDGGVVAAGRWGIVSEFGLQDWFIRNWAIKVNFDGELLWSRTYENEWESAKSRSICSTVDGFILAGSVKQRGEEEENYSLLEIDGEGNLQWQQTYDLDLGPNMRWLAVSRMDNDDLIIAGFAGNYMQNSHPSLQRISPAGEERWHAHYDLEDFGEFIEAGIHEFSGVVQDRNGSIVACGRTQPENGNLYIEGLAMKLRPEILEPQFIVWIPAFAGMEV